MGFIKCDERGGLKNVSYVFYTVLVQTPTLPLGLNFSRKVKVNVSSEVSCRNGKAIQYIVFKCLHEGYVCGTRDLFGLLHLLT